MKKIEANFKKLELKDLNLIIAEALPVKLPVPDSAQSKPTDYYYTKDELEGVFRKLYTDVTDVIHNVHANHMSDYQNLIDQINDCMETHDTGHLPAMHKGQIKAMLKSAGICDDFDDEKQPISRAPARVYSSDSDKTSFAKIEIKVK